RASQLRKRLRREGESDTGQLLGAAVSDFMRGVLGGDSGYEDGDQGVDGLPDIRGEVGQELKNDGLGNGKDCQPEFT
ncbi:MAG: hypothetical protein ACE5FD_12685, partial [Anaerolineae bacterium]